MGNPLLNKFDGGFLGKFVRGDVTLRFLLVGGWNTVFGYLVFILLETYFTSAFSSRILAYMSAQVLANFLAISNAFIGHKYFTFRTNVRGTAIFWEFCRFSMTYVFSFFFGLIMLPFFVEICGIRPKIAAGCVLILSLIFNFIGHSRFSFRQNPEDQH